MAILAEGTVYDLDLWKNKNDKDFTKLLKIMYKPKIANFSRIFYVIFLDYSGLHVTEIEK